MHERIHYFCDYFVKRMKTAQALEPGPDQHILIGAGMDALARHWAKATGVSTNAPQARMAEFLAKHGGHPCFERVATPYFCEFVRKQVKKDKARSALPVDEIVRKVQLREPITQILSWEEDRNANEVRHRLQDFGLPFDWVDRWRYGGVLYKEYRCVWIHESQGGNVRDWSVSDRYMAECTPHYASVNGRRCLTLPPTFLLGAYAHAIESFRVECVTLRINPAATDIDDEE